MSAKTLPYATPSDRLATFFDPSQPRETYEDSEIDEVANLLERSGNHASRCPRLYVVLRIIGELDLLGRLLNEGFTDQWFPVEAQGLPRFLSPSVKTRIVNTQTVILTKSLDLENGRHRHFTPGEALPFDSLSRLGSGGYGQVDRIVSKISFRQYALKRIRRRAAFGNNSKEAVKRFLGEIQIIKNLKHRHVIEYVGSYTDKTYLGLVMSPVADVDLAAFIEQTSSHVQAASLKSAESSALRLRERALATEMCSTLRTYFGCLAASLAYLHDQSIRHKDIKPQNILVFRGNVLLADFGLSRDFADDVGSTSSGLTATTPRYSPPEVAAYEARNTSADIYSLGCVFFEMVAALHGYNVDWMKRYFVDHHSGLSHFYANFEASFQLISEWETHWDAREKRPLQWIKNMLQMDRLCRPTAASVLGMITDTDELDYASTEFCGICCVLCEETDSEDSLVDEPTLRPTETQQVPGSLAASHSDHSISKVQSASQTFKDLDTPQTFGTYDPQQPSKPFDATQLPEFGNSSQLVQVPSTSEFLRRVEPESEASSETPNPMMLPESREDKTAAKGILDAAQPGDNNTADRGQGVEEDAQNYVLGLPDFRLQTSALADFDFGMHDSDTGIEQSTLIERSPLENEETSKSRDQNESPFESPSYSDHPTPPNHSSPEHSEARWDDAAGGYIPTNEPGTFTRMTDPDLHIPVTELRSLQLGDRYELLDSRHTHRVEPSLPSRSEPPTPQQTYAQSRATAAQDQKNYTSDGDIEEQAMPYIGTQEAAQKLGNERLAKMKIDDVPLNEPELQKTSRTDGIMDRSRRSYWREPDFTVQGKQLPPLPSGSGALSSPVDSKHSSTRSSNEWSGAGDKPQQVGYTRDSLTSISTNPEPEESNDSRKSGLWVTKDVVIDRGPPNSSSAGKASPTTARPSSQARNLLYTWRKKSIRNSTADVSPSATPRKYLQPRSARAQRVGSDDLIEFLRQGPPDVTATRTNTLPIAPRRFVRVFGLPLTKIPLGEYLGVPACVPILVLECGAFLKERGIHISGALTFHSRRVGNNDINGRISKLVDEFSTTPYFGKRLDWTAYDVFDAAMVLHTFLFALPHCLIPQEIGLHMLNSLRPSNKDTLDHTVGVFQDSIQDLPMVNRALLLYLLGLFALFLDWKSEMMDQIVTIYYGAFFQPPEYEGPDDYQCQQEAVRFMIEHYELLRLVPKREHGTKEHDHGALSPRTSPSPYGFETPPPPSHRLTRSFFTHARLAKNFRDEAELW